MLVNNGSAKTAAIEVKGGTRDVRLTGNQVEQTGGGEGRVGIRLGAETQGIVVEGNRLTGFTTEIEREANAK